MKLYDAPAMREADRRAIEDYNIPGILLMENAGKGAFEILCRDFRDALGDGVLLLAGKGNNGGDAYVIARYLQAQGIMHRLLVFAPLAEIRGDAALHLKMARGVGVEAHEILDDGQWQAEAAQMGRFGVIVDALLGTGLSGEVRGLLRQVIADCNRQKTPIFSVDIPSGVDAQSGAILGEAIQAQSTATFGGIKSGMAFAQGFEEAGCVSVVDIGLPRQATHGLSCGEILTKSWVQRHLPTRPPGAHKGIFGHLLVVAGSQGKAGAAIMCALAALRAGVGLVTLAVPQSLAHISYPPELMVELLPDDSMGYVSASAIDAAKRLAEGKTALAIGPGLSTSPGTAEVVAALLELDMPTVVDADGLDNLVGEPLADLCGPKTVLTPHPGEMGRLLGCTAQVVQADRRGAIGRLQEESQGIAVLKGRRTLIQGPEKALYVNPTGNSGMGTGGSGDILTGIIAAFLAQGISPTAAATSGVYIHGLCGDLAKKAIGGRALIATDLIEYLGPVFCAIEEME